jgi:predicted GNAT family N-acyltransferase
MVRVCVVEAVATSELRRSVLRPQWAVGSPMTGDDDPTAVHVAVVDDVDQVVSACVLLPRPYPPRPDEPAAWQVRGMATGPDLRGRGLGGLVLGGAVAEVLRRAGRLLWCEARTEAVRFYRKHGFTVDGDEFIQAETGLPHVRMSRDLVPPP